MSNSGKTEALPKSGHVNEVCKEWLVREDGALAYKLQSQEINDFYKGNRFRNAVVREDFPTALHEQIKEKENAEKQTEVYRRQLLEQEKYDKCIAKEIADKLERDLQEQQQRELKESEIVALKMQEIYVNLPGTKQNESLQMSIPPPRPAKSQISCKLGNPTQRHQPVVSGLVVVSEDESSHFHRIHTSQKHRSKLNHQATETSYPIVHNQDSYCYTHLTPIDTSLINTNQATSPNPYNSSSLNSFNLLTYNQSQNSSPHKANIHRRIAAVDEVAEYEDVADSIRRYEIKCYKDDVDFTKSSSTTSPTSKIKYVRPTSVENLLKTDTKLQKLSLEKYDELVGNIHKEEEIQTRGAAAVVNTEEHMQLHADDIELYVDPCKYASLHGIGVPLEDIKEINEKIKQEQKDELLARRLQEIEAKKSYNQEQRDRLLAIEEQDKELARILQEKERAKAKRAKDKARLRKTQHHQVKSANGVHCGPLFPMPQDCMQAVCVSPKHNEVPEECKLKVIDMETYSNPIDILQKQQTRLTNNTLTNGSLTRERHVKDPTSTPTIDDDIYTLPVDNCNDNTERPQSLNISPEREQQMSLAMSESYAFENTDLLNLKASKSSSLVQNCSQTPPYMPIQGTRRTNSTEDRKKKTKDKCTHQ